MPELAHDDRIWANSDRKLKGICDDIVQASANNLNVLVVAHFENTLSIVESKLRGEALDFHTFFQGDYSALCAKNRDSKTAKTWIALASHFQARSPTPAREIEVERVCVLFAEHHPMASKDQDSNLV